ncbi:MAG: LuxR C-terminal-related transcriptional regulator [Actinomycetia bacterium]|nr:LuxR C-terminal-related transcriptional regulator [Actinomycetes bacterium]
MAPRLAEMIADAPIVIISAPPEYLPEQIAAEVLTLLSGPDFYHCDPECTDREQAFRELGQGRSVLATTRDPRLLSSLKQAMLPSTTSDTAPARLIITAEHVPEVLGIQPLSIRHGDLVLTPAEIAAVHPLVVGDESTMHGVLHDTGAVPLLVAAADPSRDDRTDRAVQAAMPWAERIYDEVRTDPIARLLIWVGRMAPTTFSAVARYATGGTATPDETCRARSAAFVTKTAGHFPALPGALARALQELMGQRHPEEVAQIRGLLSQAVMDPDSGVSGMGGLRLLTFLRDWTQLDRLLSLKMHLLVHLNEIEKSVVATMWPRVIPQHLTYLTAAQAYVLEREQSLMERTYFFGPGVPAYRLLQKSNLPPEHLGSQFLARIQALQRTKVDPTMAALVTAGTPMYHWFVNLARSHPTGPSARPDETALLIHLLHCSATSLGFFGLFSQARELATIALRLTESIPSGSELRLALVRQATARMALILARGGNVLEADSRLADVDAVTHHPELLDRASRMVVDVARRLVRVQRGDLDDDRDVRQVLPEDFMAPVRAVHALQTINMARGPLEAISWTQHFLNGAQWSARAGWMWWQVHFALAMLHARVGNHGSAEYWRDRIGLPDEVDVCIRAVGALAAGQRDVALNLTDSLLQMNHLAFRWRMIATGVRIGALGDDAAAERDSLLASADWSTSLATLALLPDSARAHILPTIPAPLVDAYPGLQTADSDQGADGKPVLTKRQIEILSALAGGESMTKVAKNLFLSPETVRSSSKQIYRALGVNDRDSALSVARALGLIR